VSQRVPDFRLGIAGAQLPGRNRVSSSIRTTVRLLRFGHEITLVAGELPPVLTPFFLASILGLSLLSVQSAIPAIASYCARTAFASGRFWGLPISRASSLIVTKRDFVQVSTGGRVGNGVIEDKTVSNYRVLGSLLGAPPRAQRAPATGMEDADAGLFPIPVVRWAAKLRSPVRFELEWVLADYQSGR
jgi:hypothetical protein